MSNRQVCMGYHILLLVQEIHDSKHEWENAVDGGDYNCMNLYAYYMS